MANDWSPMPFCEIQKRITEAELEFDINEYRLWDSIKVNLSKWNDGEYGNEGGGFWVAGIIGSRVLWYNDIEGGWNISSWSQIGKIDEYHCNQDSLRCSLHQIRYLIDKRIISNSAQQGDAPEPALPAR